MCMMQAPINRKIPTVKKRVHEVKKHIFYDKDARMKGDPNFVDERIKDEKKPKKALLDKIKEVI